MKSRDFSTFLAELIIVTEAMSGNKELKNTQDTGFLLDGQKELSKVLSKISANLEKSP